MTDKQILDAIAEITAASRIMGRAYLMTNGERLMVAYSNFEREHYEKHNFWLAQIWENEHPVEA